MNNSSDETKYNEFLKKRAKLSSLMKQQLAILSALRLNSLEAKFQQLYDHVLADSFKVLVIGEFKRGKSTFVNAMLGQKVLPAHATPTTAIISEVKWGEEKKALLHHHRRKDGSPGKVSEVPFNSLEQHIVIQHAENKVYENPFEKVEVFWPLELCKNGIEIIDSPGLNEDMGRQAITLEYLSSVDAIIFVISCDSPVSLTERSIIDTIIQSGHKNIFFICNRVDIIEEEEQDNTKRFCRSVLSPLTEYGDRYIFFISASKALKGRETGKSEQVRESGLLEVEATLKTFLATERGRVKIWRPAVEMQAAINDMWQDLPDRERMLHIDLSIVHNRQIQAERDLQSFEADRNRIVDHLDKFRLRTRNYVETAAASFYRDLAEKIASWTKDYQVKRPIGALELLSVDARKRVAAEVTNYLTDQVSRAYRQWQASELLPRLDSRVDQLSQELEERTREFVSGLEQIRFRLGDGSDVSPHSSRVDRTSNIEQLLAMPSTLGTSNINAVSLGTVFNFKSILMSFAPALVVPPAVLLLGWNPFLLIPAAFLAVGVHVFTKGGVATAKIKELVGKQYELKFKEILSELATSVGRDVDDRLMEIENDLDQLLGLKIQNIRDQVTAVIAEKEQGQARVDEALRELGAIREQLIIIEDELQELMRETA